MVGGAVIVVVVFMIRGGVGGGNISDAELLGEDVPMSRALHISDRALLEIRAGDPPSGGPHFGSNLGGPICTGIYDEPLPDGNVIHSLEHGMVWITYNPDLIDENGLEVVRDVADAFGNDVVLSPRPQNAMPVVAVSWGRILRLDPVDEDQLRDFVSTNRNHSPEPRIRTGCAKP